MKNKQLLLTAWAGGLALQLCLPAMADMTITGSASPNAIIPDNNLSGLASTINLSAPASEITSVSLTLDIVGAPAAYNGDYYAYLQFSSGLIVLLNSIDSSSVTYGSPGNGMNITLSDGNPNIGTAPYTTGQPLTGTYAPQGGGASTGSTFASTFGGLDPNGAWTLFIADESPGGVGELASWSLDVTAHPETVPDGKGAGMMMFMACGFLAVFWRYRTEQVSLTGC